MLIEVHRTTYTDRSTVGTLRVNAAPFGYTLEDRARPADAAKAWGLTAIPAGRYGVILNRSNRFSALAGKDVILPLLLKVPGYEGVRIHVGNNHKETEGCLLVGKTFGPDFVGNSRAAMLALMNAMRAAVARGEKMEIVIIDAAGYPKPSYT